MNEWPKEKQIRTLIERAKHETLDLTVAEAHEMLGSFERLIQLLNTPAQGTQQLSLMLSAGIQLMRRTERLMLQAMRLDRWVTRSEEAALVHLRLICAEIIGIMTNASDDLRL
jgi:hypothetical protein